MAELTIYGAGIFGLSTAWMALKRGAKVTVIDPNGVGSGASGGIVGALQPHTPEPWNAKKQFQFESLILAEAFWSEVDETSGVSSGYARVGRTQPLSDDREIDLAKARQSAATENWRGQAMWNVRASPVDQRLCPTSPTGCYIHDTFSAILNPHRAVASLAAAITVHGGKIATEGPRRGAVVWATGWTGLKELGTETGRAAGNGVKGQAILLDHEAAGAPQVYVDGLHVIPHLDGTLAIGSTSERHFTDPTATDHQADALLERALQHLPQLADASVIKRWAGVRPRARSRAPLLGPWPDRPNHFIANGGFKIGFGMAPKCAEVLLDLVLEGRDTIPDSFHSRHLAPSARG
ncbi:MAG: FAD-dependent oxidoreductase [Pseudomonadota bacterium]